MILSLLWGTAVNFQAGNGTLNSRAPSVTLALSTMEHSCAGEAWRTLIASISVDLIIDDLFLSTSKLCSSGSKKD